MSKELEWIIEAAIKGITGGGASALAQWAFKRRGEGDTPRNSQQVTTALYSKIAGSLSDPNWKLLEAMKTDDVYEGKLIGMLYAQVPVTEPLKHEFRYRLKYLMLLGLVTEAPGSDEYTCTNLGLAILHERDRRLQSVRGG